MEEIMSTHQNTVTKQVREGDKVLTIIAVEEEENMWELKIHGKAGQATTWTAFFSTAEEAIEEADSAISHEGFGEFYAKSEFSYLD